MILLRKDTIQEKLEELFGPHNEYWFKQPYPLKDLRLRMQLDSRPKEPLVYLYGDNDYGLLQLPLIARAGLPEILEAFRFWHYKLFYLEIPGLDFRIEGGKLIASGPLADLVVVRNGQVWLTGY